MVAVYPCWLRTVASDELVHGINQCVQPLVGVGLGLSELLHPLVGAALRFGKLLDSNAQAPVGFSQLLGERQVHVHELTDHASVRFNDPQHFNVPLLEYLDIRRELRLLLDDEIHARFDGVRHGRIIA